MIVERQDRWPNQLSGVRDISAARAAGYRVIVATGPTGSGKSVIMCDMIDESLEMKEKSVLYTHRKLLMDQTINVMRKHGITHGIRSAEWTADLDADVQISSIQTEHSRAMKRGILPLHQADLVIVDEGHLQKGAAAQAIYQKHLEAGATIVLVTATPIDMGNICGIEPKLIVAGTNSELRAYGAIVPAMHYGCDEPDTRKIRKSLWEFTEHDVKKLIMVQGIFGRVIKEFDRLNPERLSSLLFAPGVMESIYFAEQLTGAGIRAAHIDGKECWIDGELIPTSADIRKQILRESEEGSIKVVCNRFVLREAIDMPWIRHGIFATVFSSLQAFIQSGGRLLRAFPGKTEATIQDHGGNWHRHGSLNADRIWNLSWTEAIIQGVHAESFRSKEAPEPFVCPKCRKVLASARCSCGFVVTRKSRPVIQADGSLREHEGDIYKPRHTCLKNNTESLWKQMYFRSKNSKRGMTFNQARGFFCYENGYYPPATLPFMPKNPIDWFRAVKDVPRSELT